MYNIKFLGVILHGSRRDPKRDLILLTWRNYIGFTHFIRLLPISSSDSARFFQSDHEVFRNRYEKRMIGYHKVHYWTSPNPEWRCNWCIWGCYRAFPVWKIKKRTCSPFHPFDRLRLADFAEVPLAQMSSNQLAHAYIGSKHHNKQLSECYYYTKSASF